MRDFIRCLKVNLKNCGVMMVIGIIIILSIQSILQTQEPIIIGEVLSSGNVQDILRGIILFIIITLGNLIVKYIGTIYSKKASMISYTKIYNDYFNKLIKLDYADHVNLNTGIVINQIENAALSSNVIDTMITVIPAIVTLVITMKHIIDISLKLSVIVIILSVILVIVCSKVSKMCDMYTKKLHEAQALRKHIVDNTISGFSTILLTNNIENTMNDFGKVNKEAYDTLLSKISIKTFYKIFFILIKYLITIAILIIGANGILNGENQYSEIYSIIIYTSLILGSAIDILDSTDILQSAIVGFNKFQETLEIKETIKEGNIELQSFNDNITITDVDFSYNNSDDILKNITYSIPKGSRIGICGPSGSGKSTLIKLITRLYDVTKGSICIDDINIKDLTFKSLRNKIGIVEQNTFLFNDTIFNNIKYCKQNATELDVYEAAKKANIHEFILSLPDGYNSKIGKNGIKLSGGQRQRIVIARVFLQNPDIILFDEATSALDNECENIIVESIDKLSKDKTVIIIAHRLSTIKNCDDIIVIDNHKIIEHGKHEELMSKKGKYYSLNKK